MTKRHVLALVGIMILVAILVAILASVDYTTGTTLDTQLFPHSRYWSIQTDTSVNILTVTTYNPAVWYIGIGDCITVSYVDNR